MTAGPPFWFLSASSGHRHQTKSEAHMKRIDPNTIDPKLRACIEDELANLPGAYLIERKGHLFLKGKNGFEILLERLIAMKTQWCALVEHADLPDEQKWVIFNLMMARDDARLEHVPGLGLKVTLPAQQRH